MDPIDSCLCKIAITGLVHLKLPEKHCKLCTKEGGLQKSLNMHDCCYFNKDGTWIKKNIDADRLQSKEKWWDDVNFAQIIQSEIRKVLCTMANQACKHKKHHANDLDRNNHSNYSSWSHMSDSLGKYILVQKLHYITQIEGTLTLVWGNLCHEPNTIKLQIHFWCWKEWKIKKRVTKTSPN